MGLQDQKRLGRLGYLGHFQREVWTPRDVVPETEVRSEKPGLPTFRVELNVHKRPGHRNPDSQ